MGRIIVIARIDNGTPALGCQKVLAASMADESPDVFFA
jgi:hypothetical protein